VIVLFIQRSSCKGSIESGVEPIAFGICNRSVGLAPIWRRNRQITAHSIQATRSACCQCAAENGQTVRHDDDGDRRDLPHRCALYLLASRRGRQVISRALTEESNDLLPVPVGSTLNTLVILNRRLGWLPTVGGNKAALFSDYDEAIAAMADAVRAAERYVHVEFYIVGPSI
jgi:hypothetical protein